MNLFSRIAAIVTAAVISLVFATPALAETGEEKVDFAAEFSSAGQPVNVVAILITGAVLLVIVLALAGWISNAFKPAESATQDA